MIALKPWLSSPHQLYLTALTKSTPYSVPPLSTTVSMSSAPINPNDNSRGSRVSMRSVNANKHPEKDTERTLRVCQPCQPPEVIQKKREEQEAQKEAKEREAWELEARTEATKQDLGKYCSQQRIDLAKEDKTIPCQQPKSKY